MKNSILIIAIVFLSVDISGCSRSLPPPEGKPKVDKRSVVTVTVDEAMTVSSLLEQLQESIKGDRNLEEFVLRFGDQSVRMKAFYDLGMPGIFVREKGGKSTPSWSCDSHLFRLLL